MSTVMRYRPKPIEVTGLVFTGENHDELKAFCGTFRDMFGDTRSAYDWPLDIGVRVWNSKQACWLYVSPGHVVLRGAFGELTPMPESDVARLYDEIEEGEL